MPYTSVKTWKKLYVDSLKRMSNDELIQELISISSGDEFTAYNVQWIKFCKNEIVMELKKRLET